MNCAEATLSTQEVTSYTLRKLWYCTVQPVSKYAFRLEPKNVDIAHFSNIFTFYFGLTSTVLQASALQWRNYSAPRIRAWTLIEDPSGPTVLTTQTSQCPIVEEISTDHVYEYGH